MSLGYYQGSDSEAIDLIARYMEYLSMQENYKSFADLFTESEIYKLQSVLDACCCSVELRHEDADGNWPDGFSVSSSDEKVLSLMMEVKKKQDELVLALCQSARANDVFSNVNVESNKVTWTKYMGFCERKQLDCVGGSSQFTYYENEIAKCQWVLDRL